MIIITTTTILITIVIIVIVVNIFIIVVTEGTKTCQFKPTWIIFISYFSTSTWAILFNLHKCDPLQSTCLKRKTSLLKLVRLLLLLFPSPKTVVKRHQVLMPEVEISIKQIFDWCVNCFPNLSEHTNPYYQLLKSKVSFNRLFF